MNQFERKPDENFMKKSRTYHRQRSSLSVMEEQTDLVQEMIEKEFIRSSLLDMLQQQISQIVENIINNKLYDFQNQLNYLLNEVGTLRNCNCQESISKQSLTLSKNSSFSEYKELYCQEDQAKYLKTKFKHLKKNINQKVSSVENHIAIIIEQQKDTRESLRKLQYFDQDIKTVENKLQEQIWQCIQKHNREYAEEKFQQFKLMIEETQKKSKERESMIWTIVNEYKIDMDELNQKVTSMNTLLKDLKDNHTWFSQIWKRK